MKTFWVARMAKFAVFALVAAAVLGFVAMGLWNWLMPALFGWHPITFWQAVGLMILSRILLGGFRGRPGGHGLMGRRMMERWEKMTPEERNELREAIRDRCRHRRPPAEETEAL